jgi:hypothetical protein
MYYIALDPIGYILLDKTFLVSSGLPSSNTIAIAKKEDNTTMHI